MIANRRRFLAAVAGTAAGLTCGEWPTSLRGASVAATIVDAHAHFYDPTRPQGVPWPPREDKLLYRPVLPKDYPIPSPPHSVSGVIVVEASPWLEDNQWLLDLAAHETLIVGIVGNLPVGTKTFAGHLQRFSANKLFRGIRLRDRKLEGTTQDPAFVSDLKLLAEHDLSLDLVGGSEILAYADELAQEIPRLRIIIDHLAGVKVDGQEPPPEWVRQMTTLAERRNVYCKLSGLVEGTGRSDGSAPGDAEFCRPVLDVMRKAFGPERLIYASNWPVSERFAPLARVQGIVEDYFRVHGTREQEQVFSGSARMAYRWVKR